MKVTSRCNRITALLVAILYVFFSTFGALSHTHASLQSGDNTSGITHSTSKRSGDAGHDISSQQHCSVCDWQANYAPPNAIPEYVTAPFMVQFLHVKPSYSYFSVCLARFSSRAPPTV